MDDGIHKFKRAIEYYEDESSVTIGSVHSLLERGVDKSLKTIINGE